MTIATGSITCQRCGKSAQRTSFTQKYCPDCRAFLIWQRNNAKWERLKNDEERYTTYLEQNREGHSIRYNCDGGYRVVSGPAAVQDFVELRSRFNREEIRLGIVAGWLPDNTILERDGKQYTILEGKKVKI